MPLFIEGCQLLAGDCRLFREARRTQAEAYATRISIFVLRVSYFAVWPYSKTWMFFFAQISFKIFGHTVTVTSPRCALRSNSINVRA